MRSTRLGTILAAALIGVATPSPAPAAGPPTICQAVAFSPNFKSDGTAFCYFFSIVGTRTLSVYVTTDGMKSWRQTTAGGISGTSTSASPGQLVVSPRFAADRTVYLQMRDGLYASTDLGESFTLASPLAPARGKDNMEFYSEQLVPQGGPEQTVILYGDSANDVSLRVQPPLHTPIAGSPDRDLRFALPPGWTPTTGTAFSLAERISSSGTTDVETAVLWSCNVAFACATELHVFPAFHAAVEVYFAPDFPTSKRMWVVTVDTAPKNSLGQHLWVSTDGGNTFTEDPLTVQLAKQVKAVRASQITVGLGFTSAKTAFLRWNYSTDSPKTNATGPKAPRANQLFRSDDAGKKWKQIGFSAGWNQAGAKGTLPWSRLTKSAGSRAIYNPAPGVLVTLAMSSDQRYMSVWCSRNAGRTWRTTC